MVFLFGWQKTRMNIADNGPGKGSAHSKDFKQELSLIKRSPNEFRSPGWGECPGRLPGYKKSLMKNKTATYIRLYTLHVYHATDFE